MRIAVYAREPDPVKLFDTELHALLAWGVYEGERQKIAITDESGEVVLIITTGLKPGEVEE